jgi:hypothetical protein
LIVDRSPAAFWQPGCFAFMSDSGKVREGLREGIGQLANSMKTRLRRF